jgi:hypothetical protein
MTTINENTINENTIVYCDDYKSYDNVKYHLSIPDEWIINELPNTGRACYDCVGVENSHEGHAMCLGIVIGYCLNCAIVYDGKRGPGFVDSIEEYIEDRVYPMYLGEINHVANHDNVSEKK